MKKIFFCLIYSKIITAGEKIIVFTGFFAKKTKIPIDKTRILR